METIIKKLDQNDRTILENFLINNVTFSKQPNVQEVQENWKDLISISLGDENSNVIACFEDSKLKAVVSQTFSKNHPFWFMNYFAAEKNSITIKKGYGKYLEMCFESAMTEAENIGYYDFYISIPEGYANVGPFMQARSKAWLRYYVLTDCIVAENEYPKYPAQQIVYGRVLKKHRVYIRHAILKQEFRKENLTPLIKC
jgi:hypothetical protein